MGDHYSVSKTSSGIGEEVHRIIYATVVGMEGLFEKSEGVTIANVLGKDRSGGDHR